MVVIGLVIALIGFAIMSRPFKIGFGLYLAFLAYYIYLYGGKGGGWKRRPLHFHSCLGR